MDTPEAGLVRINAYRRENYQIVFLSAAYILAAGAAVVCSFMANNGVLTLLVGLATVYQHRIMAPLLKADQARMNRDTEAINRDIRIRERQLEDAARQELEVFAAGQQLDPEFTKLLRQAVEEEIERRGLNK